MTNEERRSTWYTQEDMESMRNGAKKLARRAILQSGGILAAAAAESGNEDSVVPTSETNTATATKRPRNRPQHHVTSGMVRGLELFLSPKRQYNRLLTVQTVLESQRRSQITIEEALAHDEPTHHHHRQEQRRLWHEVAGMRLGCISERCSRTSRDVALVTGLSDFQNVYGKDTDLYQEKVSAVEVDVDGVVVGPMMTTATGMRTVTVVTPPPQQQQQQQMQMVQHLHRPVVPVGFSPRRGLSCGGKKRVRIQEHFGTMMEQCSKRRTLIKQA